MRVFLGDKSVEITKVFILVFEEANLRVRVVLRVFLGDQSVEITKVSSLYLRRRTYDFVLFRVLVGAWCRGAASTS